MACDCASGAGASGTAFMFCAGTRQGLCDARLYIAFGLAADGCQFRDDKIACALKHALLAERERLEMAQERQVLKHFCDFKDVARAHLLREVLETILPVIGGGREII